MTGKRARSALGLAIAWLVTSLVAPSAVAQPSDPFYANLAEEGIRAYQRGAYLRAGEDLRIASFGLLESPPQLARSLSYLALAQRAAGNLQDFESTYLRLTDLESRFNAYSQAPLDDETRLALQHAAQAQLGAVDHALLPAVPPQPKAAEAFSSRPRLCISWSGNDDCRQAITRTEPAATATEEPGMLEPAEVTAFERLSELAAGGASSRKLRKSLEEARSLADRHPDWPAAQRLTAVLASRAGSYAEAMHYFQLAGDPTDDGPMQLFYLSVALFETDQPDAAATVLRRALPALEQNKEVRQYVRRILNEETAG